jgi:hypothetical protein
MLPATDNVALVVASAPADLIRSHAEAIALEKGLTALDLLYICSAYELGKPRVHVATVSEEIETTEAVG